MLTTHIPTIYNLADLLTKVMFGSKRRNLVEEVMYDVYDYDGVDEKVVSLFSPETKQPHKKQRLE